MSLRTSILSLTTAAAVTAGAFTAPVATAASYPSAGSVPVAQLDVNQPDGALAYVFADPVMKSKSDLAVRQVRELRAKAWDVNLPYKNSTVQSVARAHGFSSREAYANAISWDSGLEHAALQRAAEANYKFAHVRAVGADTPEVIDHMVAAENLTHEDMEHAVASWSTQGSRGDSEWDQLIARNGAWTMRTGHIMNMLEPTHTKFAQAQVGEATAGLYAWDDISGEPEPLQDGRYAFPIAIPEDSLDRAELITSGGTNLGSTGSLGLAWGGEVGIPVASPSSSDPEVFEVNSDGTYEAKSEGTATVTLKTFDMVNGQPQLSGTEVSKTVKVTKKSLGGSSSGSDIGTIVGIISAVLALIGVASQVVRQFGLMR